MNTLLFLSFLSAASLPQSQAATALNPATELSQKRSVIADFTLTDVKGRKVKLSDYRGKVVVISFWATWCKPCLKELKFFKKLHKKKKGAFEILAISTDTPDTYARVRAMAKKKKWPFAVLTDQDGQVIKTLNPRIANPYTILIDKSGKVAAQHEGFTSGDEKKYDKYLTQLLSE